MSASVLIDLLVHHAHLFVIHGSSYRLKDKLKERDDASVQERVKENQEAREESSSLPGKRRKEVLRVG